MSTTNDISPASARRYPLLPYSQLVWDLMQKGADVYWFTFVLRIPKQSVDAMRLHSAFAKALLNHPVFSMAIDAEGMQYLTTPDDILVGRFHSVTFAADDTSIVVTIRFNRILGDMASGKILAEDITRAYEGLELEHDGYLDYLDYMEHYRLSPEYLRNRRWLEHEFDNVEAVHPTPDMPLDTTEWLVEQVLTDDYSELREPMHRLSSAYLVSVSALVSLAVAMAIMQYNGTETAALTWAYEGRERPEQQRIFGSMHRDIPLLLHHDTDLEALLRQARTQMRQGIAHSSYPYTLTSPQYQIWNYAVNILHFPADSDIFSALPFDLEIEEPEQPKPAYSLLDIEVYESEQLTLLYRYSAAHYKQESMARFAAMVKANMQRLTLSV